MSYRIMRMREYYTHYDYDKDIRDKDMEEGYYI